MASFSLHVNPSSVIPDSEASATAGYMPHPPPWAAEPYLSVSFTHGTGWPDDIWQDSSKQAPSSGQPLWAHTHASATSEEACVPESWPLLPL